MQGHSDCNRDQSRLRLSLAEFGACRRIVGPKFEDKSQNVEQLVEQVTEQRSLGQKAGEFEFADNMKSENKYCRKNLAGVESGLTGKLEWVYSELGIPVVDKVDGTVTEMVEHRNRMSKAWCSVARRRAMRRRSLGLTPDSLEAQPALADTRECA